MIIRESEESIENGREFEAVKDKFRRQELYGSDAQYMHTALLAIALLRSHPELRVVFFVPSMDSKELFRRTILDWCENEDDERPFSDESNVFVLREEGLYLLPGTRFALEDCAALIYYMWFHENLRGWCRILCSGVWYDDVRRRMDVDMRGVTDSLSVRSIECELGYIRIHYGAQAIHVSDESVDAAIDEVNRWIL